ncbi:hypothetical protein H4582DRAFT_2076771 [Lactarius indigo]|nr:hypothetical protein H4582DRAFT_2076771 [Lactarius indigo]
MHILRLLHRHPDAPHTLRRGRHQHLAAHAVNPEYAAAGEPAAASPIIHIHLRSEATSSASISASAKPLNPAIAALRDAPSFDIAWELVEAHPNIRLAITAALSHKECEFAVEVTEAAVAKRK